MAISLCYKIDKNIIKKLIFPNNFRVIWYILSNHRVSNNYIAPIIKLGSIIDPAPIDVCFFTIVF